MIEQFEKGVINLKNKINKKALAIAVFGIICGLIIFLLNTLNVYKRQKQKTEDAYNKALYEMTGYINNAQVELAKLKLISTDNLKSQTLAGIWRYSNLAKENLNILPLEQNNIKNTSKFLTQLSDFSYSLFVKLSKGEKLNSEQEKNIEIVYDKCRTLADTMEKIYEDLNNGRIKWNELQYVGNEKLNEQNIEEITALESLGKEFEDYEGLIYDGAFSEHILGSKAKSLSNEELSKEDVQKKIEDMFEGEIENIEYVGESDGVVSLYEYNVKFKDYDDIRSFSMTKNDGKVYLILSNQDAKDEKLTTDQAKKIGKEYLKKIGIGDVIDTYYLKDSNMAIINYAAIQDDVILYPDLVKVKVSLETGEVLSVEAKGYIFNHTKREDINFYIDIDEARSIIKNTNYILSEQMAIIPTDYNTEILTYEFKGKIDDIEFLVYINAQTGIEEKILLILDTPGGILTI